MNIRNLNISDYEKIHKLWTETQGMGMRSLDDSKEGIGKFLIRNPNTCFVAEDGKQIIGVILCGHDGRRGYIYHTAVAENHRQKGIGRKMVDRVIDALKKEGINKVALVVYENNSLGNSFWQELGFEKRNDLTYRNFTINNKNY